MKQSPAFEATRIGSLLAAPHPPIRTLTAEEEHRSRLSSAETQGVPAAAGPHAAMWQPEGQAQPLVLLHGISTGPFCGLACFL